MVLMNFGSEKHIDIPYILVRERGKKWNTDRVTIDYQFDVMAHEIEQPIKMLAIGKDNIT